jgi:iron(III) transport system substrate-binding protein
MTPKPKPGAAAGWSLAAWLLAALLPLAASAADPPAIAKAGPEERARLAALIGEATQEGQVSYWDSVIQPETSDALAAEFRKQYGMPSGFKVNYTLSNTSGLVTRIDQELQANRVTIDIASSASLPWVFEHARAGRIMEYDSPQYAAYGRVFELGLGKKGYFAFDGAYIFVPAWNEDNLKFTGTSWKDVIGAIEPQRLSVGDASKSETYLATYVGLRKVLGEEYFRNLAKMSPSFLVRSEQIASRLVSGEDLMAFSGMPTRVYQFNKRGANLKYILPKEGVVLMAQASFILKDAPHPAAAKLWLDFMLSEEGQRIIVEGEAMMSGRTGFKSPIPDYAPAIETLNVIAVDWQSITTAEMQKARKEWSAIFGR